jgi:hypothetical protein
MSDESCVICGDRPAHGAYGCVECLARARRLLGEIGDMAGAVHDAVYGLRSSQGAGMGSGVPGSRVALDLTAAAKRDAIANVLGTWARHVAEARGIDYSAAFAEEKE